MPWDVNLKPSVLDDLRWFGKAIGRKLLDETERKLSTEPLKDSKNIKVLRPNPIAERELRLRGKYRVLYNVEKDRAEVTVVLVGEKRGNSLYVQGEEFTAHESDPTQ